MWRRIPGLGLYGPIAVFVLCLGDSVEPVRGAAKGAAKRAMVDGGNPAPLRIPKVP